MKLRSVEVQSLISNAFKRFNIKIRDKSSMSCFYPLFHKESYLTIMLFLDYPIVTEYFFIREPLTICFCWSGILF